MKKLIAAATLALSINPALADEITYRVTIGKVDAGVRMIIGDVLLYDVETKKHSRTEANFKMCEDIIRNISSRGNGQVKWHCIIDFDNPVPIEQGGRQ